MQSTLRLLRSLACPDFSYSVRSAAHPHSSTTWKETSTSMEVASRGQMMSDGAPPSRNHVIVFFGDVSLAP